MYREAKAVNQKRSRKLDNNLWKATLSTLHQHRCKKEINEKLMVTNNCGKYLFRYNNDCASHEAINVKVKPGYHNKYIIKGYF